MADEKFLLPEAVRKGNGLRRLIVHPLIDGVFPAVPGIVHVQRYPAEPVTPAQKCQKDLDRLGKGVLKPENLQGGGHNRTRAVELPVALRLLLIGRVDRHGFILSHRQGAIRPPFPAERRRVSLQALVFGDILKRQEHRPLSLPDHRDSGGIGPEIQKSVVDFHRSRLPAAHGLPGRAGLAGLAQPHEFAVAVFPDAAGRGRLPGLPIQVKQLVGVRVHHIDPSGQIVQNLLQAVDLFFSFLFSPLFYQKGA